MYSSIDEAKNKVPHTRKPGLIEQPSSQSWRFDQPSKPGQRAAVTRRCVITDEGTTDKRYEMAI